MEVNASCVEEIVKQVLDNLSGTASYQTSVGTGEIPKTAHVAMLTSLEHFEIREYPMP